MKTKKLAAVAAVSLAVSLAGASTASADTPWVDPGPSYPAPRIISVGPAKYRPATNTVALPITYRCTDRPAPLGTRHWVQASVGGVGYIDYGWSAGQRNGPGGLVRLPCTGQRMTQTFILQDNSKQWPEGPRRGGTVTSHYTDVEVAMYQTASQDWAGGWYHKTGPRTELAGSVWLRSPLG